MAEPQPEGIQEGDQAPLAAPSSSEDRKAATALSNLDAKADNDTVVKQADPEALGRAMKDLKVGDTQVKEPPAKAVKVDAADVTFLAQQLDVSKARATELLKGNDASISKAIAAWIAA